jgi:GDP-D-mannose dehydratase
LADLPLEWDRADDPAKWRARIRRTGSEAIVVDPDLLRPTDPLGIVADPTRARHDLGWAPAAGLDRFLIDMLNA